MNKVVREWLKPAVRICNFCVITTKIYIFIRLSSLLAANMLLNQRSRKLIFDFTTDSAAVVKYDVSSFTKALLITGHNMFVTDKANLIQCPWTASDI